MRTPGRVVSIAFFAFVFLLVTALPLSAQMRMVPMAAHPAASIAIRAIRPLPTHVRPIAHPQVNVVPVRARINTAASPTAAPFVPPENNNFDFDNGYYGGSGKTIQQLLDPVPGLGFDYSYLAGIDKDLALKAIIDPQTEERLAVAEQLARANGGSGAPGYYLLDGGEYIMPAETDATGQTQQPQQPEVIVLQQPAQKPAEAPATAAQPPQPMPDVGNFTLILRSGKKIEAVAFTRSGNQVVYITADGNRHTIAADQLNDAATQQLNEDSGKQLRL